MARIKYFQPDFSVMDEKRGFVSSRKDIYPLLLIGLAVLLLALANVLAYRNDLKLRRTIDYANFLTNNAVDEKNITAFSSAKQMDEASKVYLRGAYDYYMGDGYNLQIILVALGIIFFIAGLIMYLNVIMRRKHRIIIEEQIGKEAMQAVSGFINIMKSKGKSSRKIREELVKMGMGRKSADYVIGVLK